MGQARPGERPVPIGRPSREAQGLGGVAQRHPGEEPQFHQLGGDGVLAGQAVEGIVALEEVVIAGGGRGGEPVEVAPVPPAAPLLPGAIPVVVDQHPPHRLGRGAEEVRPTVEVLIPDQTEV